LHVWNLLINFIHYTLCYKRQDCLKLKI